MFNQNTPLHECNIWQLAELLFLLKERKLTFTEINHLAPAEYFTLMDRSIWKATREIPVAEIILQWIAENGANDNTIADANYTSVGDRSAWVIEVDPDITFHITQEGEEIKCLALYGDEYTWYNSGEHEMMGLIKKENE